MDRHVNVDDESPPKRRKCSFILYRGHTGGDEDDDDDDAEGDDQGGEDPNDLKIVFEGYDAENNKGVKRYASGRKELAVLHKRSDATGFITAHFADGSIVQLEIPNSKCKDDGTIDPHAPLDPSQRYEESSAYGKAAAKTQEVAKLEAAFKLARQLEKEATKKLSQGKKEKKEEETPKAPKAKCKPKVKAKQKGKPKGKPKTKGKPKGKPKPKAKPLVKKVVPEVADTQLDLEEEDEEKEEEEAEFKPEDADEPAAVAGAPTDRITSIADLPQTWKDLLESLPEEAYPNASFTGAARSYVVPGCRIGVWVDRKCLYVYKPEFCPEGYHMNRDGGMNISFRKITPLQAWNAAKSTTAWGKK